MNDIARMETQSRAVRPERVALMLDISRAKVYELLAAGTMPSFTIGRVRLVLVSDVEDYLRQLRERATSAAGGRSRVSA